MVDYISKIIFGKGLDQNDGSCDNRSKQASKQASIAYSCPFFLSSPKIHIRRRIAPVFYDGRNAPFFIAG